MKSINEDAWIMQKAEEEDNALIDAGGGWTNVQAPVSAAVHVFEKSAFARFIGLTRLNQRLTKENFALAAQIPLEEAILIEEEEGYKPSPRTVYSIANWLGVSHMKLLTLAGLAHAKDENFRNAAIRFAAKSEPIRTLSSEEYEALEEFVRYLKER